MSDYVLCELLETENLSPTVRRFRFQYPFDFSAGQFVILQLPIQHEFNTRSYSIASSNQLERVIDLCIVKKELGAGTTFLFNHLKPGDKIPISTPQGKFILQEGQKHKTHLFICTGTGIAPFVPMIDHILQHSPTTNVHLIFGNRTETDILYKNHWEQLSKNWPQFQFTPVLSKPSQNWTGVNGYLHQVYLNLNPNPTQYIAYICGWAQMVKEAKNNFKALGFARKDIIFELYD